MDKDRGLPVYEPPMARDLSGGGITGQEALGWCSGGGCPAPAGTLKQCKGGSMVSDSCKSGGSPF